MPYELLATTVRRTTTRTWARGGEEAGEIWRLELDLADLTLEVVQKRTLPNFHVSPIERFGGKGIAVMADAIAVATYDTVCLYDYSLHHLLAQRSHRLMGDLHSLSLEGELLYTTSPLANSILALDRDLNIRWTYQAHDDDALCERINLDGEARERARDFAARRADYRFYTGGDLDLFHLNHHFFAAGDLVVNLPPVGRLWNVTRGDWFLPEIGLGGGCDGSFHDGIHLPWQGYYVNHTHFGTVNKYDERTNRLIAAVDAVPDHQKLAAARVGWLRGLAHLEGELFLVGQGGPSLGLVDFESQSVRKWWSFGENRGHCFFALTPCQAARAAAGVRENGSVATSASH